MRRNFYPAAYFVSKYYLCRSAGVVWTYSKRTCCP